MTSIARTRQQHAAPERTRSRDRDREVSETRVAVFPAGRTALSMSLLRSALGVARDAEGATPTVISVLGDAGMGKTHLARFLASCLAEQAPGACVLAIEPDARVPGDVDRTVRVLLRELLALPAAAPPDGGEAVLRARLEPQGSAHLAPAVAVALGWIAPGHASPLGAALAPLMAAPGALRAALTVAVGEALGQCAARAPLLVILDDAHVAGDVVLTALAHAARAEASAPIWVCALGRPVFEAERPHWGDAAGKRDRYRLGPLDPASAAALCRRLLLPAENVPDQTVQRLVRRTAQSPLLLVELVRGLHREGLVQGSADAPMSFHVADVPEPASDVPLLEWTVRREVESLEPALRTMAQVAAVLGAVVPRDELVEAHARLSCTAAGANLPHDPHVALRRLEAAGVFTIATGPSPAEPAGIAARPGGLLGFRHARVREAVVRTAPAALRRRVHAVAAALHDARIGGGDDDRHLALRAWHAGEAGLPGAAHAYLVLAERTAARHDYAEAERLTTRALAEEAGDPEGRLVAHHGRARARYRTGRHHDAIADLAAARALCPRRADGPWIDLLLDEADALDAMDQHPAAEVRVREAESLVTAWCQGGVPAHDTPRAARLAAGLGRAALRAGRPMEAAAQLAWAAEAAAALGDDGYETRIAALVQLGDVLPVLGRRPEARAALDQAVTLAAARGDASHLAAALDVRARLSASLGDRDGLAADLARSLAIARALGHDLLELFGELTLAEQLLLLDDDAGAEAHLRRAEALDRRLVGGSGLGSVALLEARLHFRRGDGARTTAALARLRPHRAAAHARGDWGTVLGPADDLLWDMLELALGDAPDRAWDALEERAFQVATPQAVEVVEARGLTAARHGRMADARAHLARAERLAAATTSPLHGRVVRRLAAVHGA